MNLPLFSLGKAEHKFRVNLMMQQKLEKKNAPSSIIISAAGGGGNRGAVSSAVASVIESTHLNDDKNSVTNIGNSQVSNQQQSHQPQKVDIDEDSNEARKKISTYKIQSHASSSSNVRYKKTSSLPRTGQMIMNATTIVRQAVENRLINLRKDINSTTLKGQRNQFVLRSNQANLALIRNAKSSLVNKVGQFQNPSRRFQIAKIARRSQLEGGIATDPAAIGSNNVFALSSISIENQLDKHLQKQMSRISLMAAVNKGRLSKKSLHSHNMESSSNILENVFSLSRDPTTLSFGAGNNGNNIKGNAEGRAETGRFKASQTKDLIPYKINQKPNLGAQRFVHFVQDGTDLRHSSFCKIDINKIIEKYDLKIAAVQQKIKRRQTQLALKKRSSLSTISRRPSILQSNSLSPKLSMKRGSITIKISDQNPLYFRSRHGSLQSNEVFSSKYIQSQNLEIIEENQSHLKNQQEYEDPIITRNREQEQRKVQQIMDSQATLDLLDHCSKALSNPKIRQIKNFQSLYTIDGQKLNSIKDIPLNCELVIVSEHFTVFNGLRGSATTASGMQAAAIQMRAMLQTVKKRWLEQKKQEYQQEVERKIADQQLQSLTATSLDFGLRTESPFMLEQHSQVRMDKISPIKISHGRMAAYDSQKKQLNIGYNDSQFGGFSTKYRNNTLNIGLQDAASSISITKTGPMFAQLVLKDQQEQEQMMGNGQQSDAPRIVSKIDQKYMRQEQRIKLHKQRIKDRKIKRQNIQTAKAQISNKQLANSTSGVLSLSTFNHASSSVSSLASIAKKKQQNLSYQTIKEQQIKYKLQTRDIYELYSRFKSIKGLFSNDLSGDDKIQRDTPKDIGKSSKEKGALSQGQEGVPVLLFMKDSPIFKGKMLHISQRILTALGYDPNNKAAIVGWDKFLYINSLLRYFTLEVDQYVNFWGKFLDPNSFYKINIQEVEEIFQNLARGVYNTEQTIISASCSQSIVGLLKLSGCIQAEAKNSTTGTGKTVVPLTDYASSIGAKTGDNQSIFKKKSNAKINTSQEEEKVQKLNIFKFRECLSNGQLDCMVFNHLVLDRYDNCFTCIEHNRKVLKNKIKQKKKAEQDFKNKNEALEKHDSHQTDENSSQNLMQQKNENSSLKGTSIDLNVQKEKQGQLSDLKVE